MRRTGTSGRMQRLLDASSHEARVGAQLRGAAVHGRF
jgi:hypothetical protein